MTNFKTTYFKLKNVFLIAFLISEISVAQHSIKGTFSPPEDFKFAILYKVTPTISQYISKTDIKKDGSFEFKLDSTATKGMYRVVYAVPQEDYNFDVIYNKKEDVVLSFSSDKGLKFIKSVENKLWSSYMNSMSLNIQNINAYYKKQTKDTMALRAIFESQRATQLHYEKEAKGMIALNFIKANKPYIPTKYVTAAAYKEQIKKHYFDYVDFNNKIIQSSGFLEERMLNYVFGISDNKLGKEANYKANIDVFYKSIKGVPNEVKRILLLDLWEQMKDLGHETVSNYISETYLLNIAKALNDKELVKELTVLINTAIGKTAPDFSWVIEKDKTKITKKLSELNTSKHYIVVFWSSGCSHCLDEIPQLYNYVKNQTKGAIHVVAVGLEDESTNWNKIIKKYPEFSHVYGKGKWDNKIGNTYGVKFIPSYFVLDKDKRIIYKPETVFDLKSFFEHKKLLVHK